MVSEYGHVRRRGSARVLVPSRYAKGYLRVELWNRGVRIRKYVQELVALAFLGEPPTQLHEVAHNDGNPGNNYWRNLRWATHVENLSDKYKHGTDQRGARNYFSELTAEDVLRIRERALFGARTYETARLFNVHPKTITRAVKRQTWTNL